MQLAAESPAVFHLSTESRCHVFLRHHHLPEPGTALWGFISRRPTPFLTQLQDLGQDASSLCTRLPRLEGIWDGT